MGWPSTVNFWKDGRVATVRGTRSGPGVYGAVAFGEKGVTPLAIDAKYIYRELLKKIVETYTTGKPPIDISVTAFRIFQEALTNIARHAGATHIEIDLNADDDQLELQICDNGKGIDPQELNSPASIGLLGMKERAIAHGGQALIERRSRGGTRVILRLPFAFQPLERSF